MEGKTLHCEHGKYYFITRIPWKYYGLNAKYRLASVYDLRSFPRKKRENKYKNANNQCIN